MSREAPVASIFEAYEIAYGKRERALAKGQESIEYKEALAAQLVLEGLLRDCAATVRIPFGALPVLVPFLSKINRGAVIPAKWE